MQPGCFFGAFDRPAQRLFAAHDGIGVVFMVEHTGAVLAVEGVRAAVIPVGTFCQALRPVAQQDAPPFQAKRSRLISKLMHGFMARAQTHCAALDAPALSNESRLSVESRRAAALVRFSLLCRGVV